MHRIKDETTGSGENLEQRSNTTFSSEASKEWQETQKVRMEVGRLMKIFVGGKSGSVHAQTLMIVSKIYI